MYDPMTQLPSGRPFAHVHAWPIFDEQERALFISLFEDATHAHTTMFAVPHTNIRKSDSCRKRSQRG